MTKEGESAITTEDTPPLARGSTEAKGREAEEVIAPADDSAVQSGGIADVGLAPWYHPVEIDSTVPSAGDTELGLAPWYHPVNNGKKGGRTVVPLFIHNAKSAHADPSGIPKGEKGTTDGAATRQSDLQGRRNRARWKILLFLLVVIGIVVGLALGLTKGGAELEAKLTAGDTRGFGQSVSVSGDTAVVGSPNSGKGEYKGGAYVFVRSDKTWKQQAKLESNGSYFGLSVAVSGDSAVFGVESTQAYVYDLNRATWDFVDWIGFPSIYSRNAGGLNVALSDDTAVVGIKQNIQPPYNFPNQNARVYVRNERGKFKLQATLVSDEPNASWAGFGSGVSVSGNTAVIGEERGGVGSSGKAYFFVRNGATWVKQDTVDGNRYSSDKFGSRVSVSGNTAIIGTCIPSSKGDRGESATIFERTGATWVEQEKFTASWEAASDYGCSVAVSGNLAVVGAGQRGRAYVYKRKKGGGWKKAATLEGDDRRGHFGQSVALSGNTAIVGAPEDDDKAGSAYVFDLSSI